MDENKLINWFIGIVLIVLALLVLNYFGITTGVNVTRVYDKELLSCNQKLGTTTTNLNACNDYIKAQQKIQCKESAWAFVGMGFVGLLGAIILVSIGKVFWKRYSDNLQKIAEKSVKKVKEAKK